MKVLSNLLGNGSKIKYTEVAIQRDNNNMNIKEYVDGVVESGSNTNGTYIKYADGTMICTKQIVTETRISRAFGNLYETTSTTQFGNYAVPFIATPIVFGYCVGRTAILEGIQGTTETNWGGTWLMRPNADTADQTYTINLLAIGKWK